MTTEPAWRTSSHSGGQGNCVQVAAAGHAIAVRDSHDLSGPQLEIPAAAWTVFTRQLKAAPGHVAA